MHLFQNEKKDKEEAGAVVLVLTSIETDPEENHNTKKDKQYYHCNRFGHLRSECRQLKRE